MAERLGLAVAALAACAYLAITLDGLAVVPPMSDDEAWIASSAHKLAAEGVLGSDLMKGFFGGERHTYHHMPLYPMALGGLYRLAGTSAATTRLLPLACGLLVLLAVFALGRRLGGAALGSLAAVLMLGLRLSGGDEGSGVPLLDLARIGRYDILVPVFGLAALLCLPRSDASRGGSWLAAGALVGLSALAHVYGAFLLVGLLGLLIGRPHRSHGPSAGWALGGFLITVAPWLWFVASGLPDFVGQMAIPAGRFDLWSPSFYVRNLLGEAKRYCPEGLGRGCIQARPGVLLVVLGLPAAVYLLLRRPERREDRGLREVAVLLGVEVLLFGTLLQSKRSSYAIAFWPLVVLLVSWLLVRLWRTYARPLMRAGIAVLLAAVLGDGALGIRQEHVRERGTTPYEAFAHRLAAVVPLEARVLGLPRFWLGLVGVDYRTWAVPFGLARTPGSSWTLRRALDSVDPDIVLLDPSMTAALEERAAPDHPFHSERVDVDSFLAAHGATLAAVLEDPTYGPVKVLHLARRAALTAAPPPKEGASSPRP